MTSVEAFAPGRTELAGNHVDHQGGLVMAATIDKGIHAKATTNNHGEIRVESAGFEPFSLEIADLVANPCPVATEFGTTKALVRGMVNYFLRAGVDVSGFDLQAESTLPAGGGLSSSAAFELLVGSVLNELFADGRVSAMELARAGQAVETEYFGKPCGLMDQAVIAEGGVVLLDFAQAEAPSVTPVPFSFAEAGLDVVLVDVGADHAHEIGSYARIPEDMASVARLFGADTLGQVDQREFWNRFAEVRSRCDDAVVLRALHYFREVDLVRKREAALRAGDVAEFCRLTALSGASSAQYLQNVSAGGAHQPAMVALALADSVLDEIASTEAKTNASVARAALPQRGVCRIHGGGFGGSIQVYLPTHQTAAFVEGIESLMGESCAQVLRIVQEGARAWQV